MLGAVGPPHRKPKKWNVKYSPYPKQAPAKQSCTALQYCCLCTLWTLSKGKHQSKLNFCGIFKNQGILCIQLKLLSYFSLRKCHSFLSSYFALFEFSWSPPLGKCVLPHTDLLHSLHQHKPHNHNISIHSILYQSHKLNMNWGGPLPSEAMISSDTQMRPNGSF